MTEILLIGGPLSGRVARVDALSERRLFHLHDERQFLVYNQDDAAANRTNYYYDAAASKWATEHYDVSVREFGDKITPCVLLKAPAKEAKR